jgi:hypothetical protein
LASLASLGALARGETATNENGETNENVFVQRKTRDCDASARNGRGAARRLAGGADRKAPARRTLAASRAARLELQEEEEEEEEEDDDDIDDDDDGGEDDDVDGAAASAAVRFGVAKDAEAAEDAVPCTEGEEVVPEAPTQQKNNAAGGLMSAMARLPPRAPGSAADEAPARLGGAGPSQRGGARGAHRHGSNAPSARLQRIMHRVRARQAQFLDTAGGGPARDAGSASADAAAGRAKAWGRPLRVTLVGECGAEAGLCLWECVCEDDDDASFADAAFADADEDLHLERGGSARDARSEKSDREWLRRGADAPAPGAVLAMDGRAARELSLRGGSRVSVFPPWNEVEVPPSVATGFKRRRVVVGTLVAV